MRRVFLCSLLTVFVALPGAVRAQNYVTPTVKSTPPGHFIVVNNGPGDQTDPHVSGNLVVYTNTVGAVSAIHYFDLATRKDAEVPNPDDGTVFDFLPDVSGTTIVFTRVTTSGAFIYSFDTSTPATPPAEVAPTSPSPRSQPNVGDQAIVWQQGNYPANIAAYDRTGGTITVLSNNSPGNSDNQSPAASPDGTVVTWQSCTTSCAIWKATLSGGTWNPEPLVSQVGGNQSRADSDGTIIAYSAAYLFNGVTVRRILWQPVAGGTEQVLNYQGETINPGVSGGVIAFDVSQTPGLQHEIAVYDQSTNVVYNVTSDIAAQLVPGTDKALDDISVTPDGQVRVVWEVREADWNVYAYTFQLPERIPQFSSFHVEAEAELTRHPTHDQFEAHAEFQLNAVSAGINPAQGSLHFSASDGSTNLVFDVPLNQFHIGRDGRLNFEGLLNGYPAAVHLSPPRGHHGSYEFSLEAKKLNLAHLGRQLNVVLQIGNNIGQTTATLKFEHQDEHRESKN